MASQVEAQVDPGNREGEWVSNKQYRISLTLEEMEQINTLIEVATDDATDRAFDSASEAEMTRALWWRDLRRRWSMRTRNAREAESGK